MSHDIEREKAIAVLAIFKDDGTPLSRAIRVIVWDSENSRARLKAMEAVVEAARELQYFFGLPTQAQRERIEWVESALAALDKENGR